jgi:hypothetical protein
VQQLLSSPEEEVQTLKIHSYGFCWTPPLLCDEVATGKSRESESAFDGQGLLVSWFVPKKWIMELAVAIERPAPVAHGATVQRSALYANVPGSTPISVKLMGRSIRPEPGNPQSAPKPARLQISVTCAGVFSIQGQNEKRRGQANCSGKPLHSPRDFLQLCPALSSVWGGGRWPPLEGGAAG